MATARRPTAGRRLARDGTGSGRLARSFALRPRSSSDDVKADYGGRVLTFQPRKPEARVPMRVSFDHQPGALIESA